jgi:WhiB family redox-sensing transcriptional regulator
VTSIEIPVAGLTTRPATGTTWRDDAPCGQVDPELWFPEKGRQAREAMAICASCDVRRQCLEYALTHCETGIWGGTTDRERMQMRNAKPGQPTLYNAHREVRNATIHRLATTTQLSPAEIAEQAGCDERTVHRVRTAARGEAA